ncbi:pentapeptide repeat-containing protein [Streptomyces sp. NPDC054887]
MVTSTNPDGTSTWWGRLEGIATLLAAGSALAAAGYTLTSISEAKNELAITREGQITDRYNKAVGHLDEESTAVRMGGIYALERLMQDSHRDQKTVISVLSAYVRLQAPQPGRGTDGPLVPTNDVAAALSVIATRDPRHDGKGQVDLTGAYLQDAQLDDAQLSNANLNGVTFTLADMDRADLRKAKLGSAQLDDAHLEGSLLQGAELSGANLASANLSGANLTGAQLHNADLDLADLRCAVLRSPDNDPHKDAEVTIEQIMEAQLDRTTKLPVQLADDPRLKQKVAEGRSEERGCPRARATAPTS